jgi:hypothetical protein
MEGIDVALGGLDVLVFTTGIGEHSLVARPGRQYLVAALADGKSHDPQVLAQSFYAQRAKPGDPSDGWRRYLTAIRQQSLSLARDGKAEFLRKGKPIAINEIRGVVRIRQAARE